MSTSTKEKQKTHVELKIEDSPFCFRPKEEKTQEPCRVEVVYRARFASGVFVYIFNELQRPKSKPKKWDWDVFVDHYYNGEGKGVTLSEIGLDKDFENAKRVRYVVDRFMEQRRYRLDVYGDTSRHVEWTSTDVTFESSELYSIGNSSLKMASEFDGYDLKFKFSIHDSFTEPLRQFGIPFDSPFSKPYDIDHTFTRTMNINRRDHRDRRVRMFP